MLVYRDSAGMKKKLAWNGMEVHCGVDRVEKDIEVLIHDYSNLTTGQANKQQVFFLDQTQNYCNANWIFLVGVRGGGWGLSSTSLVYVAWKTWSPSFNQLKYH